jgi:hypothetical protein
MRDAETKPSERREKPAFRRRKEEKKKKGKLGIFA